jgi:hypothetical protein
MPTFMDESTHPRLLADYRQRAHQERALYIRELVAKTTSLPSLSLGAKRSLSVSAAALVLATAGFWAVMLTSPKTEAGIIGASADTHQINK